MKVSVEHVGEIKRCAKDFRYFCKTHLRIISKDGDLVPLVPNASQDLFLKELELNNWVYVLKARKLGQTTIIAAVNFWRVLFRPNYSALVVAHTDEAAKGIFKIYKRFYECLPEWLQVPMEQNLHEMRFETGALIRATTASSQSVRGQTYQSIHCSEFAMYPDIDSTIAAVFSTAGNNGTVVLESTANGVNPAHRIWYEPNGMTKLFLSWKDAKDCRSSFKPNFVPPELKQLAEDHGLSRRQLNWATQTYTTRCASSWNTFLQEYPLEPDLAFISSGRRFFTTHIYPHAVAHEGYEQYASPQPFHIYTLGVDTASGSAEGDYSAFCLLDVTDKRAPRIASSFYGRMAPAEFARQVLIEAKKYNALIVPESNSYGLSIIEYLVQESYGFLYRRVKYDKMANRYSENLGFNTNVSTRSILLARLQEYVAREWLLISDERLKKEINTFVFSKSGRPEADTGQHDDMVFAVGLALMGLQQIDDVKEHAQLKTRPANLSEMLQYEIATGKLYSNTSGQFHDPLGRKNDELSPSEAMSTPSKTH
tara:strand:- start:6682 stop:8295 length:1614 start_codon:yes stop_codon:yes gene_type:complete